ncbi:MarR family winged helix-turn-helix transcriptional regulator [Lysobacter korlensis]|uniref:MarR family winged helix-turn-helix transcriptional regulator n=1 Tax=Lysobacter korlensis TaxID=553636 RepID=A0ABV6RZK3_9GAMM
MLDSMPGSGAGGSSTSEDLPEGTQVPFRSELLASLAEFVHQWNHPDFSADNVARVDARVGVPGSRLLMILASGEALRPSDLAAELLTGASNVSKLLAHLEGLGFVERRPDAGDARVVRVHLTESGRAVAEASIAAADRTIEHMTRDWTEEEIRTYASQTRRLAAAGRDYVRQLRSEAGEA